MKARSFQPAPQSAKKVLVILLGDLGYFIQGLAAAKVIREHHFGARITLLTTPPYKTFAEKCPYFDVVEADGKPTEPRDIARLIAHIRSQKFDMIYDLQNSGRTNNYFHGLKPWPPLWSGAASGCSHPAHNPARETMHPLDRLADQLHAAGIGPPEGYLIGAAPLPDLSWIRMSLRDPPRLRPEYFGFKAPYILIIPGSSTEHAHRRWPPEKYAELAGVIASRGLTPVLVGAAPDRDAANAIAKDEPRAKNIVARTDLFQVASLAEHAAAAIGTDSGPMHIAAAAGCPCVVLFPYDANTDILAPRGAGGVLTVLAPELADLPVADVDRAIGNLGAYAAVTSAA
jgi:ADP-heptose:LPS heptosyltransferase